MMMKIGLRSRGFTLVELLLVVAVLAVLALLAVPRIASTVVNAKERTCAANMRIVEEAVNRCHADRLASGLQAHADIWPNDGLDILSLTDWQADADFLKHFKDPPPECPFQRANTYQVRYVHQGPDDETSPIVGFTVTCTGNAAGTGH